MEEQKKIKKIGVLTSGGDAPGMNAAIRAVVRTGRYFDLNVIGIRKGYNGLINGEIKEMYSRDVSNVMNLGGTILHTARCPEMMTPEGLDKAAAIYKILSLDALIVIGGDGSYRGMAELAKRGVNCVGIPATIDLDMNNTEYTIGFDTAVNTGMDALNKLRDTSSSHERCSVVEVMGRDAGYIAVWCGMVGGAEDVMFPEEKDTIDSKEVIQQILANRQAAQPDCCGGRCWRHAETGEGYTGDYGHPDKGNDSGASAKRRQPYGNRQNACVYDGLPCGKGSAGRQGKYCHCL